MYSPEEENWQNTSTYIKRRLEWLTAGGQAHPPMAVMTERPEVAQSSRLAVSAGLWSVLDSGEVRSTTKEASAGGEMGLPGRVRASRQKARLPSSMSIERRCSQMVWPRLRVGLLTSNDPIKKHGSQVCPAVWILVDSRYRWVDNLGSHHKLSVWHIITSPYVIFSFQMKTKPGYNYV